MDQQLPPNADALDPRRIDAFLRLALADPDEALLGTYFAVCTDQPTPRPLSEVEQRWVTTNLQANPNWQARWHEYEVEWGQAVAWKRPPLGSPHASEARPPIRPTRRPLSRSLRRLAGVTALLLGLVYGTLWMLSATRIPETYTLASLAAYQGVLTENTRSAPTGVRSHFASGAQALQAAPQHTLGLFPHYDLARVEEAIVHFHQALEQTEDPFQRAEVAFFLAKAYLMTNDVSSAKYWLEQVLAQNVADYRADTEALLERLPQS